MNIKRLPACVAAMVLFLSACKSTDEELPADTTPFLIEPGEPALIVAHRGGRDLKPENTLLAFDNAVALGADVLEMDVCLTKDSILVTSHDLTVDRTSDTTGNIIDYTYQQLQAFNFGYDFQALDGTYPYRNNPVRIPKLEDIFARYPHAYMVIEIKDAGASGKLAAEKLMALIRSYGMAHKAVVFSFSDDVMNHVHSINSDSVFTGASFGDGFSFVTAVLTSPDTLLTLRCDVLAFPTEMLNINLTSDTIITAAHRNHAAIHYWTINDKEEMKSLIQKGADGIITDRPDLMKEALAELGF